VSFLREPDAIAPHVRFDERDVETEHGEASEAPADERVGQRIGPTYTTAPHLDSTPSRSKMVSLGLKAATVQGAENPFLAQLLSILSDMVKDVGSITFNHTVLGSNTVG